MKNLMLAAIFCLCLFGVSYGQQKNDNKPDKNNCPSETKEVKEKGWFDLGFIGGERETRQCEPIDKSKDPKDPKGPTEKSGGSKRKDN